MSDLFHEKVDPDFIKRVFKVMVECPQHDFQVLTKRPERARALADQLPGPGNVWMGTSVESAMYTHRITDLQHIPAQIRFLSCEPLLGPIPKLPVKGIHWVIVGGESGPGARPMEKEWVTQIRDRCLDQEVAFFFKQWGGVQKSKTGRSLDRREWNGMPMEGSKRGADRVAKAV
jgi:protein gp37